MRKKGPVQDMYKKIGVACFVVPEMASFRPADRKNLVAFIIYAWRMRKYLKFSGKVRELANSYNIRLIHVNHESLALTGALVAWQLGLPWVAHIRTLLTPGWFARRVYGVIARYAKHSIFITNPNFEHFRDMLKIPLDLNKCSVIHNITPDTTETIALDEMTRSSQKFKVLSLTNFAPSRGVDRIIEVAEALKNRGESDFEFFLFGQPSQVNAITGLPDKYYENLQKRVHKLGLNRSVFFLGHTAHPEKALAGCDALLKLTRQSNPWGRDIIEALAAGVPILTLGVFTEFVEDGVNGYITKNYNVENIVDRLLNLSKSSELCEKISEANRLKAKVLFNGKERAKDIVAVYTDILNSNSIMAESYKVP
tara:strand:- start:819 stop:1919 length:1101 start_codon:yes stop_codon:yes gene_type:complete